MSRNDNLKSSKHIISDTSDDTSADENEEVTIKQLDDDLTKDIQLKLNNQSINDLEDELSQFRLQWKQELLEQQQYQQQLPQETNKNTKSVSNSTNINNNDYEIIQQQNEEKAVYLFNKGVLLEQQGRFYEAIKFYRMAMQLDPDIEFKVANNRVAKQKHESFTLNQEKNSTKNNNNNLDDENDDNNNEDDLSLYEKFHAIVFENDNCLCEKQFQQKGSHFSSLPYEVVIYILKWVVSEDLDLRSLDTFSSVCKGFYVCSRDPEIWKTACERVWRGNSDNFGLYGSWRDMYLKRIRLNFDGCYICKTSYIRTGEQSLDSFYRPWHLVEYFRFLRFFPDGTVLMYTTPEEPKLCVAKLKQKKTRDVCILTGNWTLNSNRVSVLLVKKVFRYATKTSRRGNAAKEVISNQEQLYNMVLEVCNVGKKMNFQLIWVSYGLHIVNKLTNTESSTSFDVNKIDFPPFYFFKS